MQEDPEKFVRIPNEEYLLIRPFAPGDETELEALVSLLATPVGKQESPKSISGNQGRYWSDRGEKQDHAYWVLIDERKGYIVGGIGFGPRKEEPESGICEMQNLYLHPDLHGTGVGRTLVKFCMREAAKCGYHQMALETASSASPNGQFNKNSGLRFFRAGKAVKMTPIHSAEQ